MAGGGPISRSRILQGDSSMEATWFSVDQFYRDHMLEIGSKLPSLDDGIWGKLILMEKNRRIAKAYLRAPSLQVDGSRSGFDGGVVGFNSFPGAVRDGQANEIRNKICSGVAIKIDRQGNVLAKRRGRSPVIVQGSKSPETHCLSTDVINARGRLDVQRVAKIFDMRAFKEAIDLEFSLPNADEQKLLYKSAVRISLVKEECHPLKTPCWLMLINIVAVDVLISRLQNILPSSDVFRTLDIHQQKRRCASKNADPARLQSPKQPRARSELDIQSSSCGSQETPSTESGLDEEEEMDSDSVQEIINDSTSIVLPSAVAPAEDSFSLEGNKSSTVRFNRHAMLSKLKPRYWDVVGSANRHSSYESSLSSAHSFVSNGRSYSPSLLSDSFSETQTTDSGFQEAHSVACASSALDRPAMAATAKTASAAVPAKGFNDRCRTLPGCHSMCKSCLEIYHLIDDHCAKARSGRVDSMNHEYALFSSGDNASKTRLPFRCRSSKRKLSNRVCLNGSCKPTHHRSYPDGMPSFASLFAVLLLAECSAHVVAANSDPQPSTNDSRPLDESLGNSTKIVEDIRPNATDAPTVHDNSTATQSGANRTLVNNPRQVVIQPWRQENNLFDGDIAGVDYTGEEARFGIRYLIRPWPKKTIPYTLDPSYSSDEVGKIKHGMELIANDTCLRFVPRTNESYYLRILNTGAGCYSYVGNRETLGGQILSLESTPSKTCIDQKVILHELLHAAGLWHEHNRGNRNKYLNLQLQEVIPRKRIYFTKLDPEFDPFAQLQYDQGSIMHFPTSAWARKKGHASMLPTNPLASTWLGNGRFVSLDDRYKIKWLYGCLHRQNDGRSPLSPVSAAGRRLVSRLQFVVLEGPLFEQCRLL
uniref:Metalloendopeptidase n=1 Tax=Trichuris muris TaxID=70415 RepID=A0A5S6R4V4_TRIMR